MKRSILELDLNVEEKLRKIWNENNFSLDMPIIDLQHIWLIWLLLQLEEELTNEETSESIAQMNFIISELINYTTEHFWLEECLLEFTQFPEEKEHVIQHKRFVEEISRQINNKSENRKIQISEFIGFLKNWLFGHILIEDAKYKKFFIKDAIDSKPFFEDLIKNQKSIVISKSQANLYNRICGLDSMTEVISKDIAIDVFKVWKAYSLNLKIPIIDIQHLWLVKLLVELDKANKTMTGLNRSGYFQKTIMEAIQYAKDHFTIEESIMREFQYDDFNRHFKSHRNFIESINTRNMQKKEREYSATIGLINDLKEWLISHIAIEDKQLSLFLKNHSAAMAEFIYSKKKEGVFHIQPAHIRFYLQIRKM